MRQSLIYKLEVGLLWSFYFHGHIYQSRSIFVFYVEKQTGSVFNWSELRARAQNTRRKLRTQSILLNASIITWSAYVFSINPRVLIIFCCVYSVQNYEMNIRLFSKVILKFYGILSLFLSHQNMSESTHVRRDYNNDTPLSSKEIDKEKYQMLKKYTKKTGARVQVFRAERNTTKYFFLNIQRNKPNS